MKSSVGVKDFCRIALEQGFLSPEEIETCVSDYMRAERAGRDLPLGQILMDRELLTRRQVAEIMHLMYPEKAGLSDETSEESDPSPDQSDEPSTKPSANDLSSETNTLDREGKKRTEESTTPRSTWRASERLAGVRPQSRGGGEEDRAGSNSGFHQSKGRSPLADLSEVQRRENSMSRRLLVSIILVPVFVAFGVSGGLYLDRILAGGGFPPTPEIVLDRELTSLIEIEQTVWLRTGASGRLVLLIHYRTVDPRALPRALDTVAIVGERILEQGRTEVHTGFETVRRLANRLDRRWLKKGALLEPDGGLLLLEFSLPEKIEKVIIIIPTE